MTDKAILITGCSSGIGLQAATTLHKRGYRVFAGARKPADVEKLQQQGLESILIDVTNSSSIQQAVHEISEKTGGHLFALFNNAGYLQAGAIEDLPLAVLRAQFETNVFGVIALTQCVLPIMRQQGYGRIIQNSSILGQVAMPFYGAYNASKFALEGFSNSLRQELRGTNIYVSIINPGPIESQLRNTAYHYYQKTVKQPESSVYRARYEKMEQAYFKPSAQERKMILGPDAVVTKLIDALESPQPKIRYYIGTPARLLAFLRCAVPESVLDWMIEKIR